MVGGHYEFHYRYDDLGWGTPTPYLGPGFLLKMAASQGYQCQFIDSVFDDLYCKKCTLVARRLTITNCCGESFCHTCIADKQEQGNPCPTCGEKNFATFEQVKNRKRINSLRVYCSMKERGCDWSGMLEQLDTHLDPDQDNCQYVDTKCPLNCQQSIPRNKVEQHVAQHCAKRPYVCQHCNFKATYEEVVDAHLPECKYVPLQCPNLCGVTFERDFMEDHMKMCHLEEVGCEFRGVGCDDQFIREDQEEHTRQNSQKHLTLTASVAVETKEQLQQKLLEQDEKHKEEEEKLKQNVEEQDKKIEEEIAKVDTKLQTQHQKHMEVEERLRQKVQELEKKTEEQENTLEEQEKKLRKKLEEEENKRQLQEKKLEEQEKRLGEQNEKLAQQEKKLEEEENKQQQQEKKLEEQEKRLGELNEKLAQQEKKLEEEVNKRQQQEKKVKEQEKRLWEQNEKVAQQEKKLEEEERKLNDQDKTVKEQEKKLKEQEKKMEDLNKAQKLELDKHKQLQQQHFNSKLQGLELMLKEVVDKSIRNEGKLAEISDIVYLNRKFEMKNFSHEKAKDLIDDWKSPAMYTHMCGYKFCVGVAANGYGNGRGKAIGMTLWSMPGEFDSQLKWPAKASFIIEFINQQGGEKASYNSGPWQWRKPTVKYCKIWNVGSDFLKHSELNSFLNNDTLFFHVSRITMS